MELRTARPRAGLVTVFGISEYNSDANKFLNDIQFKSKSLTIVCIQTCICLPPTRVQDTFNFAYLRKNQKSQTRWWEQKMGNCSKDEQCSEDFNSTSHSRFNVDDFNI